MSAGEVRSALGLTVDTLHEAARAMREAACVARPGDWYHGGAIEGIYAVVMSPIAGRVARCVDAADAEHIASWHPAVALAVADWLDRTAHNLPVGDNGGPAVLPGSTYEAAVAVATAYLGVSA